MKRAILRAAAGLALGLLLGGGCSSDQERFERHLQRASEFVEAGRAQEGLVELRAALEIEPDSAVVSHRIAVILEQAGQTQDAVFFYREAYRLDSERDDAALAAAELTSLVDPAGARALVEQLIEREPGNALAHARLASITLREADTVSARIAARKAVELGPAERDAWLALGQVEQAHIRELRLLGRPVPEEVYAASLAAFEQAAALGVPSGEAELERARVLATWPARAEEAPAAYRQALERALASSSEQNLRRTLNAALAFGRAGDPETLRAALNALLERWPDRAAAWQELAGLEERLTPGSGDAVFARAFERSPTVAVLSANAAFLVDHGRSDDAIALLESALRERPNEASLLAGLANLQSRSGNQDAAHESLRLLVESHPGAAVTEKAVARVAARERRLDVAAERLRLLTARTDDVEALQMLARAEYELRDLPAASRAADQMIDLAADEATSAMHLLRAELRYVLHDHRGTLEDLQRARELGAALTPHDRLQEAGSLWALGHETRGLALLRELVHADGTPLRAELMYIRRVPSEPDARAMANRLLEQRPRNPAVIEWLAEHEPGGPEAARARLDAAIADGIESPRLLLQRAELRLAADDLVGALNDAEVAFERGAPGAGTMLAQIHDRAGRLPELATTLEHSADAGTLDNPGKILLAHLQIARDDPRRAEALLEEALLAGATRPSAKSQLALLLALRDAELERALALALDAVGRMPGDPTAAYALGTVSLREGLPEQALAQLRTALALAPRSAAAARAIHQQRGLALEALGRSEEAQRAFGLADSLNPGLLGPTAGTEAGSS